MSNETDIAVIKEKVEKLERWVDNADKNHFPSIEKRFDRLETRLAYWGGGLAVFFASLEFIFKYVLK